MPKKAKKSSFKQKKIVYAIMKDGDVLSIIKAKTKKEAQAKLEAMIAQDYMKRHRIQLLKMTRGK